MGDERSQLQNGGGRITAGRRDELRLGDRGAVQFGKPVDRLLEQVRMAVRSLVPVLEDGRILEPIIRAQIDTLIPAGKQPATGAMDLVWGRARNTTSARLDKACGASASKVSRTTFPR
jgi:hypothetical protein